MINPSKIPSAQEIQQIFSGIADRSKFEPVRQDGCPAAKNALTGIDVTSSHRLGITWDGTTLRQTSEITVTRDSDGSVESQEKHPDSELPTDAAQFESYITQMIRHRYLPC